MREIHFSDLAKKTLKKLDKGISNKIYSKIEMLVDNYELVQIKKLKSEKNLYRIRVGDYRVIFEIHSNVILITKIGNRKDIYK